VLMLTLVQGVTPGLGGIIGSGDRARAVRVRQEMLVLTWLLTTVTGGAILVWNESFVGLWVGAERYAGPLATLLIVVMIVQFVFIRSDNYVIDVTLRMPVKVMLGALSAVVSISCAVLFVGVWDLGIPGLCAGIITGRAILTVASPWLVGRALDHPLPRQLAGAARPAAVTAALFYTTFLLGQQIHTRSWPVLAGGGLATAVALIGGAAVTGLTTSQRRALRGRVLTLLRRAA
jgi:hypothetical protein